MSWTTSDSIQDAVAITPSATPLARVTRAIYVGGAGTMTVTMVNGTSAVFNGLPAGAFLPIQILAFTAGSATGVLALY